MYCDSADLCTIGNTLVSHGNKKRATSSTTNLVFLRDFSRQNKRSRTALYLVQNHHILNIFKNHSIDTPTCKSWQRKCVCRLINRDKVSRLLIKTRIYCNSAEEHAGDEKSATPSTVSRIFA